MKDPATCRYSFLKLVESYILNLSFLKLKFARTSSAIFGTVFAEKYLSINRIGIDNRIEYSVQGMRFYEIHFHSNFLHRTYSEIDDMSRM